MSIFTRCTKNVSYGVILVLSLASSIRIYAQIPSDIPGVIPLNAPSAPASDLIYQGRVIVADEAEQLRKQGTDLSTLDPDASSDLWQSPATPPTLTQMNALDQSLAISQSDVFENIQAIPARSGNFRFVAYLTKNAVTRPYTFMVSKTVHNVLLRKALLRKLGYTIAPNQRSPLVHLKFSTPAAKELFIDSLSQSTFGDPKRWIVENNANSSDLILQDVIAFDADTSIYNLALGFIPHALLKGRRVLNALSIPFELVDNPESVNMLSWSFGRTLSNYLKLNFEASSEFDGNYDDARWISRRLLKLTPTDWSDVVASAKLPQAVSTLLLQKIIARRNDLAHVLKLSNRDLPYNPAVSLSPDLTNGKLTRENWPGYGSRFSFGDPDSPLSNSELWALGKSKLFSSIFANALIQINTNFMGQTDIAQALQDHQKDLAEQAFLNFLKTGNVQKVPFGFYALPIWGANLIASRDVVIGSYLGTDNQVQLADAIGISVYAGAYVGVEGLPVPWSASIQGKGTLTRTYTHLRPIKSIKAALKYPFKNVLVPLFLKEQAQTFDEIALVANDPSVPDPEKQAKLTHALSAFKDNLGIGESVIISDSIGAGVDIQAGYNYSQWAGAYAKFSANQLELSRLHILRFNENTIHIYRDLGDTTKLVASLTLKAFIPVVEISASHTVGQAHSKFYALNIEDNADTNPGLAHNLLALREVLSSQSLEAVDSIKKPFLLNYAFDQNKNQAGFLWWKWASLKSNLRLEVIHPESQERRAFFRKTVSKMDGKDFESVATDAANAALQETLGEGTISSPGTGRPSDSIGGSSVSRTTNVDGIVDGLIDADRDFIREPYVSIDYSWQGWALKHDEAQKILNTINAKNSTTFYPPDALRGVNRILFYNIDLSYQLYTPAVEYMLRLDDNQVQAIFQRYSPEHKMMSGSRGSKFLSLRRSFDRKFRKGKIEKYTKYMAELVTLCESTLSKDGLFAIFGGEHNLLISSRIQGFREGDENGDKPFFSNTMGEIGSREISGPIEDMRIELKIAPSEFFLYWILERL